MDAWLALSTLRNLWKPMNLPGKKLIRNCHEFIYVLVIVHVHVAALATVCLWTFDQYIICLYHDHVYTNDVINTVKHCSYVKRRCHHHDRHVPDGRVDDSWLLTAAAAAAAGLVILHPSVLYDVNVVKLKLQEWIMTDGFWRLRTTSAELACNKQHHTPIEYWSI